MQPPMMLPGTLLPHPSPYGQKQKSASLIEAGARCNICEKLSMNGHEWLYLELLFTIHG